MLFVVGQNAVNCSVNQLQEMREHMRAETGLLVVGGADEQLRLSHRHKREQGVTQAVVDHLIIVRSTNNNLYLYTIL
jgi:regulatory NSL complex subunit 3